MTPQSVQLGGEIRWHAVRVFLRRRVSFRFAQHAVAVNIESIVVTVQCQITGIQGVIGRANVPLSDLIKAANALTHVSLKSIRHPVAV